ncbi:paraneoplastic antigen Ma1-like [Polypterus senegalus]|uniref:paraneoplastic antigen Ma1-like n=1 Tax=Polypterus senegalus TaxID=55291 RepID=UPI0019654219|nr:paraneoplastic antigen Ma1-like [Polypterus senegalus]
MSFLKQEGKSLADIQDVASPALTLNTELVSAINSLVQKCQTASPVEAQNYRKLRTFSGLTPTPNGEEDYEVWAEHTTHILEEWQCSDNVKKQRLVECLRGPAADIVRFVKVENPSATSCDYLKALDTAFGPTENASDLMVKFRNTFQEKGEKLSVYIIKLDKLLHSVLRKGGLKSSELNRLRIEQIIRGALPDDMVALRLRMTHKFCEPPPFTELLKEVREEENMIHNRSTVQATVTVSSVASDKTDSADCEVELLKKEIRGLRSEMARLLSAAVAPVTSDTPKMHSLAVTTGRSALSKAGGGENIFCYKCGENGHFKQDCANEKNLRKVNRLIKMRRVMGNYPGAQ